MKRDELVVTWQVKFDDNDDLVHELEARAEAVLRKFKGVTTAKGEIAQAIPGAPSGSARGED